MVIDRDPTQDDEQEPLDISEQLRQIIEVYSSYAEKATAELMSLRKNLIGKMDVKISLDYSLKLVAHAKLIKELFLLKPFGAEWKFKVRASKSQSRELKNIFGDIVEVIEV